MLISKTETKNNAHWLLNHVRRIQEKERKMNRCASKLRWRQQNATEAGSKILKENIAHLKTSLTENGGKRPTYGSGLVKARVAMELILELRYTLWMLGVHIDGPALVLCGDMLVDLNTTVPGSVLKKKHLGIWYHRVREAVAAKAMRLTHIRSEENIADVLTKALPNPTFHALVRSILFRVPGYVRD